MMDFRRVKQSVVDILGASARGRYKVLGYQKVNDAEEASGLNRTVQIFYSSSVFPPSSSSLKIFHDITFRIELIAAAVGTVDLLALQTAGATEEEKAVALLQSKNAPEISQKSFDELLEIIFQIIMDRRNIDLQLPIGTVANRWISSAEKDPEMYSEGQNIITVGSITLNCRVFEEILGDIGVENSPTIITTVDVAGDDIEQTEVKTTLPT